MGQWYSVPVLLCGMYGEVFIQKEEAEISASSKISVQHLHGFAAAAGNYITGLHVQQLMADGAVDITFLFCPNHTVQTAFQFIFHC